MGDTGDTRRELTQLLTEAGVTGVEAIVAGITDEGLSGAMGAYFWWNEMPHIGARAVSTGLLVKKIKEGGIPGYVRAAQRTGASGEMLVGETLLRSIRGVLLSPDGRMTRRDAYDIYAKTAEKLNCTVDSLVDSALDPLWRATPPHPAMPTAWDLGDWKAADDWGHIRYAHLVMDEEPYRPTVDCQRIPGESAWDYACRFWNYSDSDAVRREIAALAKAEQMKRDEARKQKEADEAAAAARAAPVTVPDDAEEPW